MKKTIKKLFKTLRALIIAIGILLIIVLISYAIYTAQLLEAAL